MIGAVGLFVVMLGSQANRSSYLAGVTQIMRAEWPNNRTLNIVCHGHSVPAGYFQTPTVNTFEAYPNLLHVDLARRFPHAVINVIVTAIGGENSEQGAKRFASDVLSLHPDVVTIDYSLNDRGIGLSRAKTAWVEMIRAAQDARVKLILLTPTPDQASRLDDPSDPLNLQAEQVRGLAREYNVGLVDSLVGFKDRIQNGVTLASLMSQSNHPNRAGHEIVAEALGKWFP